jgi:hypothetical protein
MTVVSDDVTPDEPNGTEVCVPTKRGDDFASLAREFFAVWAEGSVLVNGEPPARVDGLWLSDTLLLTDDYDADSDVVVMGNVPYPMSLADANVRPSWRKGYSSSMRLVAFVDIGEVSFTPSRESLQMTKRTRARVDALYVEAESLRDAAVRAQVADAPTAADAIRVLREGQRAGFAGDATYDGRTVPLSLDRTPRDSQGNRISGHPDDCDVSKSFLLAGHRYAKVKGERTFTLPLDGEPRLYFRGFDGRDMTPTKRDKLAVWAEAKGLEIIPQVFVQDFTKDERYWTDGIVVHEWADVDAVKLTKSQTLTADATRPRGSYVAFVQGQRTEILAADIDTSRPVYWFQGGKWDALPDAICSHSYSGQGNATGALDYDAGTVVVLPANRVDKFVRDFPSAAKVDDAVRRNAADWLRRQNDDALSAYAFQSSGNADRLRGLNPANYDDPALSAAITAAGRDTKSIAEGFRKFRGFLNAPKTPDYADAVQSYPLLLDGYGTLRQNESDVIIYTNAAYAARKGADNV